MHSQKNPLCHLPLLVFSLALSQCSSPAPAPLASETKVSEAGKHRDMYQDQSHWPGACQRGKDPTQRQSPIPLADSLFSKTKTGPISFHYRPADADIVDNGHTILYKFKKDAGYIEFEGAKYFIKQFHFHKASEHTLNGKSYPMEVHFVHLRDSKPGQAPAAVALGFLAEAGKSNAEWNKVWEMLPARTTPAAHGKTEAHGERILGSAAQLNVRGLVPKASQYMVYEGSLTTPACDEIVTHVLAQKTLSWDPAHIAKFASYHAVSNRELQPMGDAKVRKFRMAREN